MTVHNRFMNRVYESYEFMSFNGIRLPMQTFMFFDVILRAIKEQLVTKYGLMIA